MSSRDIAIIGIAARFPEASGIEEVTELFKRSPDLVRELSAKRVKDATLNPERPLRPIGYLEDIDKFDHPLFELSLAEAQVMDPHHRLMLESVYHLFEHAGYNPDDFDGSRTAVFVSDINPEYYRLAEEFPDTMVAGNSPAFAATRISRQFNLTGNAAVIDTACSSSLVAVHMAVGELLLGEADCAIVCGVNLNLQPYRDKQFEFNIWSPDCKSRAFSEDAAGMSCGELSASVLLKPLEAAQRDGDTIHAIIKSTAVNNNARRSASPTAPDSISQAGVVRDAWRKAGVDPRQIGYIEAHGSGTKLGDSLEVEGLSAAFRDATDARGIVPISTIKSSLGHGYNASGIAGLVRAVMALKHRVFFPTLHFERPNELIDFENSAVYVNKELREWPEPQGHPRYAGVTSLGASGTNCHVLLQEAPESVNGQQSETDAGSTGTLPFVVSARTPDALKRRMKALADRLQTVNDVDLTSVSWTLARGRKHYRCRFAASASSAAELREQLRTALQSLGGDAAKAVVQPEGYSGSAAPNGQRLEAVKTGSAAPLHNGHASGAGWMLSLADSRSKQGKAILLVTDHTPLPEAVIQALQTRHPVYREAYTQALQLADSGRDGVRALAHLIAMYRLLSEWRMPVAQLLPVGIGRLAADVIAERRPLAEVMKAAETYEPVPLDGLEGRVDKLIASETAEGDVLFVELAPGGELGTALGSRVEDNRFRMCGLLASETVGDPIAELLCALYVQGHTPDWQAVVAGRPAQRAELPGYPFEPIRCWVRETPQLSMADLMDETGVEKQAEAAGVLKDPAATELERRMAVFWSEALELDALGRDDHFFELGGDSLLATRVIRRIREELAVKLDFEDLFDYPTLSGFSAYVDSLIGPEDKVAAIFRDVLKQPDIGPNDSFFELGGHSLMANQVLLRVRGVFGVELNFEEIFRHPTPSELSRYMAAKLEQAPGGAGLSVPETAQAQAAVAAGQTQSSDTVTNPGLLEQAGNATGSGLSGQAVGGQPDLIPVAGQQASYPVSAAQKRMWMLSQFPESLVAYNSPFSMVLEGQLDEAALASAFEAVVDRHEVLRTVFGDDQGEPVQIIRDRESLGIALERRDLQVEEGLAQAEAWMEQDRMLPFDLASGPLVKAVLFVVAPQRHVLYINMHHIISDGWSSQVLLRELAVLYNAQVEGQEYPLSPLRIQYKDYAQWQARSIADGSYDGMGAYWRETLGGSLPTLELPLDKPRPPMQTYAGERIRFALNAQSTAKLQASCRTHGVTLYMALLAATNLVLYKYSGQSDLLIGSPIAGRSQVELEDQLGFYANTIVLRTQVEPDATLANLLESARTTTLGAYQHQLYPFDRLVEELAIKRDMSRSPLFNVMLVLQNTDMLLTGSSPLQGLTLKDMEDRGVTSLFDLHLEFVPTEDGIQAALTYNTDLFFHDTMQGLAEHLQQGLQALIASPDLPVREFVLAEIEVASVPRQVEVGGGTATESQQVVAGTEQRAEPHQTVAGSNEPVESQQQTAGSEGASESQRTAEVVSALKPATTQPEAARATFSPSWSYPESLGDERTLVAATGFGLLGGAAAEAAAAGTASPSVPDNAGAMGRQLAERQAETLVATPWQLELLLETPEAAHQLQSVRRIGLLTQPDELMQVASLADRLAGLGVRCELIQLCGSQALGLLTTCNVPMGSGHNGDELAALVLGKPLPGIELLVCDADGQPLPAGVSGQIMCRAAHRGDTDEWQATGWQGRRTAKDKYRYDGETRRTVEIKGFAVQLHQVEQQARALGIFSQVRVIMLAGEETAAPRLTLVYRSDRPQDSGELKGRLKAVAPAYAVPEQYVQVEQFPLDVRGGLDEEALHRMAEEQLVAALSATEDGAHVADSALEETLAGVWSDALAIKQVGRGDHFFEMGGDSIKALRASIRLKKLGYAIELKDLFLHPTVAEMAAYIATSAPEQNEAAEQQKRELEGMMRQRMASLRETITSEWEGGPADAQRPDDAYPMSDIEKGLVFHSVANPGTSAHMIQYVYSARYEQFDEAVFLRAFALMADKHPNLRASFHLEHTAEPVKIVHAGAQLDVTVIDLEGQDRETQRERIESVMAEENGRPFEFREAPLWRTRVFHLGGEQYLFLFIYHQSIMDGWSNAILMKELSDTYFALLSNPDYRPQPLLHSYKQFVLDQYLIKHDDSMREYWREELRGYKRLALPEGTDREGFTERVTYRYRLEPEVLAQATELAGQLGVTLRNLLFAVYARLMSRLTNQDDAVVGILTHNRPACEDGDAMVGFFLNMLPVRTQFAGEESWADYIRRFHAHMLELSSYEKMALSEIARAIGDAQDAGNPISDTLFNFTDFRESGSVEEQSAGEAQDGQPLVESKVNANNTWLDFNVDVSLGRLDLKIDSAVYDRTIIDDVAAFYREAITRLAEEPELKLADIRLRSDLLEAQSEDYEMEFDF
ncbi:condensation domain-containing protein [Paenibacillus daejeonensis]|uniref:condensation domain-containing protein n=1 Tax=Paenibacillus daejeonensis TaxID=135193 RepID=UPI00036CB601|nr:condensation domain-containing protein [Paenibacillus daejeonensis]